MNIWIAKEALAPEYAEYHRTDQDLLHQYEKAKTEFKEKNRKAEEDKRLNQIKEQLEKIQRELASISIRLIGYHK